MDNMDLIEQKGQSKLPEVLATLTPLQSKFAMNLALYDNILKSGRLAGYDVDTNAGQVYKLLQDQRVIQAVEYWKSIFAAHAHTTPEKILATLSQIAHIPVTDYFTDSWEIKEISELSEAHRQALTGVEVVEKSHGRTIKLKFAKVEALKELASLLGMHSDDKDKRQGLSLTIQLGQVVQNTTTEEKSSTYGHIQLELDSEKSK
jgi:hypothetical protein